MAFELLLPFARTQDAKARRTERTQHQSIVLEGNAGDVYDERAFRHFLALERRRAAMVQRPCMLLLVRLRQDPADGGRVMSRAVARAVFDGLQESTREVDFIGWYREGRVAAAVLPQGFDALSADVPGAIVQRVRQAVGRRLPAPAATRLRVRVLSVSGYHR